MTKTELTKTILQIPKTDPEKSFLCGQDCQFAELAFYTRTGKRELPFCSRYDEHLRAMYSGLVKIGNVRCIQCRREFEV